MRLVFEGINASFTVCDVCNFMVGEKCCLVEQLKEVDRFINVLVDYSCLRFHK